LKKNNEKGQVVIIGAGPTGLGAASCLDDLGLANWIVLESQAYAGGLSASFRRNGFIWDIGGHIYFSSLPRYKAFLSRILNKRKWRKHLRKTFVNLGDRWVPYPFQTNLAFLSKEQQWECLRGLIRLYTSGTKVDNTNFLTFIKTHFGEGITNLFLRPYNTKLWAFPLEKLGTDWITERVTPLDLEDVLYNVLNRRKDNTWGPNNTFYYPSHGGTGEVWRTLAHSLPPEKIQYNSKVSGISTRNRTVTLSSGERFGYDFLINTMPLTQLIEMSDQIQLKSCLKHLNHSRLFIVGIALKKPVPNKIRNFCWMYFPGADSPFYRATILSNYSPQNVPEGYWSLLLEVSGSSFRPLQTENLIDKCLSSCLTAGMIHSLKDVCDIWTFQTEYGYPTPTKERKTAVDQLLKALEREHIYSRGRFGTWRYEIGNMDHSYLQGMETVERIFLGQEETVFKY
jgi:protoporphyrinogen oxidase